MCQHVCAVIVTAVALQLQFFRTFIGDIDGLQLLLQAVLVFERLDLTPFTFLSRCPAAT
ncbi:hypothetical protein D3C75_1271030 [compost metagenome]